MCTDFKQQKWKTRFTSETVTWEVTLNYLHCSYMIPTQTSAYVEKSERQLYAIIHTDLMCNSVNSACLNPNVYLRLPKIHKSHHYCSNINRKSWSCRTYLHRLNYFPITRCILPYECMTDVYKDNKHTYRTKIMILMRFNMACNKTMLQQHMLCIIMQSSSQLSWRSCSLRSCVTRYLHKRNKGIVNKKLCYC